MEYNSNNNKALLWKIMYENQLFNNINPNLLNSVKEEFENIITKLNTTQYPLAEKNKHTLVSMNNILQKYREEQSSFLNEPYLISEKENKKNVKFNNDLIKRQEEYDNSLEINKPTKIDFSDNYSDKPIGAEMDSLISEVKQKRYNEINLIINEKKNIEIGDKISIPMDIDNIKESLIDNPPSKNINQKLSIDKIKEDCHPIEVLKGEESTSKLSNETDTDLFLSLLKTKQEIKMEDLNKKLLEIDNKLDIKTNQEINLEELEKKILKIDNKLDKIISFLEIEN